LTNAARDTDLGGKFGGLAVAGVYAAGLPRGRRGAYHSSGLTLAISQATVTALFQLVSGDFSGRVVARYQPAKRAAREVLFDTQAGCCWPVGGWLSTPTSSTRT
jgi:cytochrome d ubiquinol oxidase subunit I